MGELRLCSYQYEMIKLLDEYNATNVLQEFQKLATDTSDSLLDISSLKKRIKYCKNPMERKNLEKQLNAAYKEMKKRR